MRKYAFLLTLIIAALLAFTACGDNNEPYHNSESNSEYSTYAEQPTPQEKSISGNAGYQTDSHLSGTITEANELMPEMMDEFSIPGMVVAIVDVNEGFTWVQGFGYADTTQGVSVDGDTVFAIGSISKTFTAIAVMQLVEDGIIDLDTPIVEYLPDFSILPSPTGGDYRNITTRMLLTHTSGIPTQVDLSEDIFKYGYISLDEHNPEFMNTFLDILSQYHLDNPEGEVYEYSNNGYVLLGVLVAAMTGNDNFFDDFVRYTNENIFNTIGMSRTSFVLYDDLSPFLAMPYVDAENLDVYIFINGLPTGSMVSTAYDMARFMHILLDDSGDLLSPGAVYEMMQPHDFDFTNIGMEYGLGFLRVPMEGGITIIGHNGQWFHYQANMFFDVETGLGVFVALNSLTGAQQMIAQQVALILLEAAVAETQ